MNPAVMWFWIFVGAVVISFCLVCTYLLARDMAAAARKQWDQRNAYYEDQAEQRRLQGRG